MRVWPIKGDDNDEMDANFRDFAIEALIIQDTVVRTVKIAELICVRSSPNSIAYLEILEILEDVAKRDFYFSRARNLAQFHSWSKNGHPAVSSTNFQVVE